MWSEVASLYRQTRKEGEHVWTMYLTRPFAALLVHVLQKAPITPNQVTVLAFVTSLGGAAVLAGWLDYWGLVLGALIYQVAYVLDCVDGQLARLRGVASPIGHLLDFMFDEAKAKVMLVAVAIRLFRIWDDPLFLLAGLGGLALVSIGLSLTTFTRRPEYPQPEPVLSTTPAKSSPLKVPIRAAEWVSKQIINYPTYVVLLALADAIEVYFWAYIAVYLLYTTRTFLAVVLKLGSPTFGSVRPHSGD